MINGQKMWTSLAQYADYIWLAARTDENAKKHKGLSATAATGRVPSCPFVCFVAL